MQQNIIELLQLEREAIKAELTEVEAMAASYYLIANTSEEPKAITTDFNARFKSLIDTLNRKKAATEAKEQAFTAKLHSIGDPELKAMAKAYFIEGRSCEEIGRKYYLDRTTVYKRLKRFFDS